MGKEYSVQEALKLAIKGEKDSMDFYRKAATVTKNERARKVFDLLANEEVGHLKAFFDHYKGGDFGDIAAYMAQPVDTKNPTYMALVKAIDEETHEQKALEIALKEEKACIDQYTVLAKDIIDPLVKGIFQQVIKETEKHLALIEEEYRHVMTMVHESDQDTYVRE
ncbi:MULTISPECIES: ferritin family protein [Geobacter]|uniref:Ferritin n=2 Tax=Geobacter TaxID=28231 RepID=A0A0C1QZD7_9BACT|nr:MULTISPECIES: ferritin family protein [Geobacter]ANA41390.1 ferritin [Geobacter anodireducens]KIE43566.1 ferritin [Geobacter soli]MBE2889277.1 ferritin family protein [Geobacter anodireducens]HMN03204.1 ferritin family protein [Geobacter anodireducens]